MGHSIRSNRELAVLKGLYSRCREWRLFEGSNPVTCVKLLREPKRQIRFLEVSEEERLLNVAEEPLRTLILVGIFAGLRLRSEALTLRWQDIDFERGFLVVQAAYAKTGKQRSVALNSVLRAALERLPRRSEWVFTKPNGKPYTAVRGFREACKKAGLIDFIPGTTEYAVKVHSLRHTFATRLIENGVDLRTVQELGGWSNLEMLIRYGHVSPGRKVAAVEGLIKKSSPSLEKPKLVTA